MFSCLQSYWVDVWREIRERRETIVSLNLVINRANCPPIPDVTLVKCFHNSLIIWLHTHKHTQSFCVSIFLPPPSLPLKIYPSPSPVSVWSIFVQLYIHTRLWAYIVRSFYLHASMLLCVCMCRARALSLKNNIYFNELWYAHPYPMFPVSARYFHIS